MIYRIYPVKDTFITNAVDTDDNARRTGSNVGQSEELQVFKSPGISGAIGSLASSSLGRSMLLFDMSAFNALTSSGDIPTSGGTFRLHLSHKTSDQMLPSSFDLSIHQMTQSNNPTWDEGRGLDVTDLDDHGAANWERSNASTYWTTFSTGTAPLGGGDFFLGPVTSSHFDTGYEDLDADITSLVNGWNSGTIVNDGLMVKMTSSIEADTNFTNYYVKKFYSRHSSNEDRRPYIEYRVSDFTGDDRLNMQWARTGTLYLYNVVGGDFSNLVGNFVTVTIADGSGTLLTLTASQGTTGIYSASFALSTGSYSGSVFFDRWGSGSFAFTTGSFGLTSKGPNQSLSQNLVTGRVRNIQDEYLPEDVPLFEVFFRKRRSNVAFVLTGSSTTAPYIVENAFYAIENDATRERVIPFGTGSQKHTRLSYGATGNSFRLYMSSLHSGNVYRMVFLVDEQGRKQVVDPGFRFKIN